MNLSEGIRHSAGVEWYRVSTWKNRLLLKARYKAVKSLSGSNVGILRTRSRRYNGRSEAAMFMSAVGIALGAATAPDLALGEGAQKAFPSAGGFGEGAQGGRGGAVMLVTTLADSGQGSLRECVSASHPRTCVFRVSGPIELKSQMKLGGGRLTIAGQTAPGGGILLRAADDMAPGALLRIERDDVIVRHLRFRRGASGSTNADHNDTVQIRDAENVIFDHVSISWGVDENLSLSHVSNVTIQWSIIAEALYRSNHPKGPHSMGSLLYGDADGISMHHNVFAHNQERNPRIKINGTADVVNNVIYNSGTEPVIIDDEFGKNQLNFIANTYRKGPNSPNSNYMIRGLLKGGGGIGVYTQGNDVPNGAEPLRESNLAVQQRFAAPLISAQSASAAYSQAITKAGALPRDAIDQRIINDVRNRTGRIIDSLGEAGGWPRIDSGIPYADADQDGMSDSWELTHGLHPGSAADRNGDLDGDGYTNLEEFLNQLANDPGSAGEAGPIEEEEVVEEEVTAEPEQEVIEEEVTAEPEQEVVEEEVTAEPEEDVVAEAPQEEEPVRRRRWGWWWRR